MGDWGSLDILPAFGAEYVGSNPASLTYQVTRVHTKSSLARLA